MGHEHLVFGQNDQTQSESHLIHDATEFLAREAFFCSGIDYFDANFANQYGIADDRIPNVPERKEVALPLVDHIGRTGHFPCLMPSTGPRLLAAAVVVLVVVLCFWQGSNLVYPALLSLAAILAPRWPSKSTVHLSSPP